MHRLLRISSSDQSGHRSKTEEAKNTADERVAGTSSFVCVGTKAANSPTDCLSYCVQARSSPSKNSLP